MRDVLFAMPLARLEAGPYIARATRPGQGRDRRGPPAAGGSRSAGRGAVRRARARMRHGDRARPAACSSPADDRAPARAVAQPRRMLDRLPCRRGLADRFGREQYADAAALLGAAFDAQPDDAALAFVLGWARVGAGDRTGAVTAFRNAALLEPTMVPAHLALADTYLALGPPGARDSGGRSGPQGRPAIRRTHAAAGVAQEVGELRMLAVLLALTLRSKRRSPVRAIHGGAVHDIDIDLGKAQGQARSAAGLVARRAPSSTLMTYDPNQDASIKKVYHFADSLPGGRKRSVDAAARTGRTSLLDVESRPGLARTIRRSRLTVSTGSASECRPSRLPFGGDLARGGTGGGDISGRRAGCPPSRRWPRANASQMSDVRHAASSRAR